MMTSRSAAVIPLLSVCLAVTVHVAGAQVEPKPVRTFAEFVGTWILDEAASTGPLTLTPRIPLRMTIATTPNEISVTKRLRLDPRDAASRVSDSPPTEVYRFDGTETKGTDVTMAAGEAWRRFTLVADMLALTTKQVGHDKAFTMHTDALAIEGDVLTLHRQLSSINGSGQIYVMQHLPNNTRHTYVYRREDSAAR